MATWEVTYIVNDGEITEAFAVDEDMSIEYVASKARMIANYNEVIRLELISE